MPKPVSDKSSAGRCSPQKGISDRRRTVLRIFLAAFAVLLVFSLAAAPASAIYVEHITINSVSDLVQFRNNVNTGEYSGVVTDVLLTANLYLDNNEWEPIGNSSSHPFKGTFDGDGYTISNLRISSGSYSYTGLFGYTDGATIKNLGVINVDVGGMSNVGGLVGQMNSGTTITNCYATGAVEGSTRVGGLVGWNSEGTITNCYATGTVTGTGEDSDYVGGLVGLNKADSGTAEITNCYATGAVEGWNNVGGLVGLNYAEDSGTASITNCYATGTVTGDDMVGGLVGWNYVHSYNPDSPEGTANIINCYATGTVTGDDMVGGLVGWNYVHPYNPVDPPEGTANIINSVALNQFVSATGDNVSRVAGYNGFGGKITYCYAWEGMKVNNEIITGGAQNNVNGDDAKSVYVWDNIAAYKDLIPNFDTNWKLSTNVKYKLPILIWQSDGSAAGFDAVYLKPLVVTFDSKGGSSVDTQKITKGFEAVEPIAPTKDGYTFGGWYTDSAFTTKYYFDTPVMADKILYAKWIKNSSGGSGGSSTDSGSGHFDEYPRTVTNGGFVTFGTSPTVSSVDLPEGVSGSVILVVKSNTPGPDGKPTYTVFEINIPNYPEGEEAVIQFKITLEELKKAGYNPEDICLYHCDENGVWTALPTTFTIKDGVVYYESVTTAFSPFAIVFEENGATEVTQPEVTAVVPTAEPEPTSAEPAYVEPTMPATTVPTPEQTKSPVGVVGLGLGLLGAAVVLRRK